MKLQVVLIIIALGVLSMESVRAQSAVLCGRRLAETIAMVCDTEPMMKKSISNSISDHDYEWRWLTPHTAHRWGQGRTKRGIVSECCDKPCSIDELLTYC